MIGVSVLKELNDVARASVHGGFFLFIGITSSTIIMALTSVLVARLLGPEDYGLYTVIMISPIIPHRPQRPRHLLHPNKILSTPPRARGPLKTKRTNTP